MKKKLFVCIFSILLVFSSLSHVSAKDSILASGTYNMTVDVFDWGPNVTKVIVSLDTPINEIDKSKLNIKESKQAMDFTTMTEGVYEFDRKISDAYLSDEKGNMVKTSSKYFTIEMDLHPSNGSILYYDRSTGHNIWADPYDFIIDLKEGEVLESGKNIVDKLNINKNAVKKIFPKASLFKESAFTYGDVELKYGAYSPQDDSNKNPLIIWLHGAGEGGTDTTVNTLGNNVPSLAGNKIQDFFNGAYILAPQTPTMWMDDGTGNYTKDGTSMYTEPLMKLIENYVNNTPDIDTNRIYIGGCSNGGYMTMDIIFNYPTYFAGAFPICEAYSNEWITDDMLNSIKDIPIWFTHAANDPIVDPETTTLPTYDRLIQLGAKNVHLSYFDDVHDTSGLYKGEDGLPYQYNGHFTWIYALNNECIDNNVSIFEWLSKQTKEVSQGTPSTPDLETPGESQENNNTIPKTGDKSNLIILLSLIIISSLYIYSYLNKNSGRNKI
ncbi:MAG: peptidase [Clostridium sp.]|uniref:prolyl oligopeptidase family serine peptidase n=1 Tax=Clostridium sp. TaxID=1506 RepID=UPI00290FAB3F|nr:prolyl oligopeptidase family serine peptidase [Clostridium sp.]MDU4939135.1 peptidase [Clostridium sp.]